VTILGEDVREKPREELEEEKEEVSGGIDWASEVCSSVAW